jgi:inorganic pyrophosphatase
VLSKVLPTGMVFPFDFGFLPGTHAADGDPLDVLLLMDSPVFPGCVVESRLIGILEAEQRKGSAAWTRNDRVLAVADESGVHGEVRKIRDLSPELIREIEEFFVQYNRVAGREFRVRRIGGASAAAKAVNGYRRPD